MADLIKDGRQKGRLALAPFMKFITTPKSQRRAGPVAKNLLKTAKVWVGKIHPIFIAMGLIEYFHALMIAATGDAFEVEVGLDNEKDIAGFLDWVFPIFLAAFYVLGHKAAYSPAVRNLIEDSLLNGFVEFPDEEEEEEDGENEEDPNTPEQNAKDGEEGSETGDVGGEGK